MVKFIFYLLDFSSGTIFLYQKFIEFNLVFDTVAMGKHRLSSLKPADTSDSSFCTFKVDSLAAHELFVVTLSCYWSFSFSGVPIGIVNIFHVSGCASRDAVTLSATSFLIAA
ncbi:hypothetical protein Tco_1320533 [Tanacetum coccineum]